MKKGIVLFAAILTIIIIIICIIGTNINSKTKRINKKENEVYENYLNGEIYGTDVITLINKATNQNEANFVQKDEKGYYINNRKDSIQIDIEFIIDEEENETQVYKMEQISKLGSSEFIKNFNEAKFKCIEKKYHSDTQKISYIKLLHVSQ